METTGEQSIQMTGEYMTIHVKQVCIHSQTLFAKDQLFSTHREAEKREAGEVCDMFTL